MEKLNRLLFDIICIVAIIILPYFVLDIMGFNDYISKN